MTLRLHLDDDIARDLEPREKRFDAWDDVIFGLCLSVTPAGCRTWYFLRKISGRAERIRLGRFPTLKVKGARKAAGALNNLVAVGRNPAEERRQARAASSLGRLWLLYHSKVPKAAKSMKNDAATYNKHLKKHAARPLPWFNRVKINKILKSIPDHGARRNVRALLGMMWRNAEGLLDLDEVPNPLIGVRFEQSRQRERYLDDETELPQFLDALDNVVERAAADALLAMLLSGQRPGQIRALRWEWIHTREREIVFPAWIMKRREEHRIPLTDELHKILLRRRRALSAVKRRSVFVFPSTGEGGHLQDNRSTWKSLCKAAGLRDLQPRDLRRTWRTYAGEAEVAFEVAEALMHHKIRGVAGVYLKVPMKRKRIAAERVEQYILEAAGRRSGATVVNIATGRRR